jgi:histidyl-tRNA synthetase
LPEMFSLPRGMSDVEPEEMSRRIWLCERIREIVLRYGFQLVEPSTIENLETLEAKSGPAIRNEIYWFKDKSERNLGLRFDLTVGLTRMIASRTDLPEPIKYAAIGGNWRYDEPQFGRYRYFTQWDIEIFGTASPAADAEVICVGADILENVGLANFKIKISNRRLTESYLNELGLPRGEKLDQTLRIMDKIRKVTRADLEKEFSAIGVKPEMIEKILAFVSINGTPREVLHKLTSLDIKGKEATMAITELRLLADSLEAFGRITDCVYDLSIVRGIGYYDGIVFEGYDENEEVGAVFGGGRYDGLHRIYGKRDLPATGVAGGVERLMISLEKANLFPKTKPVARVFVAPLQDDAFTEAAKLATRLREMNIPTQIDLKGRSLSKQLEYVNASGIPYLIVLGRRELESRVVKIKNMLTRVEIDTELDAVGTRLGQLE